MHPNHRHPFPRWPCRNFPSSQSAFSSSRLPMPITFPPHHPSHSTITNQNVLRSTPNFHSRPPTTPQPFSVPHPSLQQLSHLVTLPANSSIASTQYSTLFSPISSNSCNFIESKTNQFHNFYRESCKLTENDRRTTTSSSSYSLNLSQNSSATNELPSISLGQPSSSSSLQQQQQQQQQFQETKQSPSFCHQQNLGQQVAAELNNAAATTSVALQQVPSGRMFSRNNNLTSK